MKKLFVSLTIYPNFLCLSLSLYLEKKKGHFPFIRSYHSSRAHSDVAQCLPQLFGVKQHSLVSSYSSLWWINSVHLN